MNEGDFWNNVDSFVEQQKSDGKSIEKVGDWLKNLPVPAEAEAQQKQPAKAKSPSNEEKSAAKTTPPPTRKSKKQVSIEARIKDHEKVEKAKKESKKNAPPEKPRSFSRRIRMKRKRKRHETLYFGPLIECNFNLPRVAQQLERLMGSSVVRLTDRKYMLDLQKRIQEDYHDTLMKRITQRKSEEVERELRIMLKPRPDIQAFSRLLFTAQSIVLVSELEREKRMGVGSEKYPKMIAEHPVFVINQKTNSLLMSKRAKLKTVREKNAERLIKQGKRWERERFMLKEQERLQEIATKKEREKMLEEQTLYIFDPSKVETSGMDILKIKSRKFTECEIDLKDFLLSEKDNMRKRMMAKSQSSEDSKRTDQMKSTEVEPVETKEVLVVQQPPPPPKPEPALELQISTESMRKKQAKKDEDPRITKFKNAESVKEIYQLAEELIAGDGKKKLLKQIKQMKRALNLAVIKGAS